MGLIIFSDFMHGVGVAHGKEGFHVIVVQGVVDFAPLFSRANQPFFFQKNQLMGDGRLAHAQKLHEFRHIAGAQHEGVENLQPRGIGHDFKDAAQAFD